MWVKNLFLPFAVKVGHSSMYSLVCVFFFLLLLLFSRSVFKGGGAGITKKEVILINPESKEGKGLT